MVRPNAIAKALERSPSSIIREIKNHIQIQQAKNDCMYYISKNCHQRCACKSACNHRLCKFCPSKNCTKTCEDYIPALCDKLQESPYVCNGCDEQDKCKLSKHYYKASFAQKTATTELRDKRTGFDYTEEEIRIIDKIVSPLVINGQTPYAVLQAKRDTLNKKGIKISKNTLYRLIDAGMLSCKNIDLPEKVKRRNSKLRKRNRKETYAVLTLDKAGHLYGDYLKYIAKHDVSVVEMDCVEGKKSEPPAILTLHFRLPHMQLGIIMEAQTAECVVNALDKIEESIGYDLFREMLPLILTDNGHEFSDLAGMERSYTHPGERRTMIFYCEPNRSDEKGSCERNHREIRKIIPKGTSINSFMQKDITLMINHVNSYVRESLHGKCPYDIAMAMYPEDFFVLLGLDKIPADEVIMNRHLLDYARKVS